LPRPCTWKLADPSNRDEARLADAGDDDVGNDNLLCESGETCVHMPNIATTRARAPW
jgi:hypothetical protein